jgi:hypothetical protein
LRPLPWENVERYRVSGPGFESYKGDDFGAFRVPCGKVKLAVIASNGDDRVKWEHVSVSIPGHQRTPTWEEMDYVKQLFWDDDETVIQLHVPRAEHKNHHPWCLHLWRPKNHEIPRPPSWTVA